MLKIIKTEDKRQKVKDKRGPSVNNLPGGQI